MSTDAIENQENEVTGQADESQVQGFTQDDVNRIVADRIERERRKFEKQFDGVDLDRYRELTEAEEARKVKRQKERGEFDAILKETVSKKDQTIESLQKELKSVKVDGALLNAAATNGAIDPGEVVQLLHGQVRLSESGEAEVFDPKTGQVRYNDRGDPMSFDDLTKQFLNDRPHHLKATPKGSGTTSNVNGKGQQKVNLESLDLTKPEDRKIYEKNFK